MKNCLSRKYSYKREKHIINKREEKRRRKENQQEELNFK